MRILFIYIMVAIVLLTGCTKPVAPKDDPIVIVEPTEIEVSNETLTQEEQDNILKEFYNKLNNKISEEEIIKYLDENISKLDSVKVDDIIIELDEHLRLYNQNFESNVNTLMKYYEYSTDEIKSYLEVLDKEAKKMFTDGEEIKIELKELLDRAILAENHLKKYPEGKTQKRVQELYSAYIEGAIIGTGNQFIYAEDSSSTVKKEVLDTYKSFVEINKDSNVTKIISNYLEVLSLDNNDMNGENTLKFYENISNIINENIK